MNYVLSGVLALMLVLMLIYSKTLHQCYCVRRRSRILEKYIGSATPFGELVSLLTLADMAATGEVEIGRERLLDTHDSIAKLTRELVLRNGRKNPILSKELQRMGYPLDYSSGDRYVYRLSKARISILTNASGS